MALPRLTWWVESEQQRGFAAFDLVGRAVDSGWASESGSARHCDVDLVPVEVGGGPGHILRDAA